MPSDEEPLPADQITMGLPPDCELVGYADLRGAYGRFDAMMQGLRTQSWVAGSPEFSEALAELLAEVGTSSTEMTAALGFNPLTDLTSVAGCARLTTRADGFPAPEFLLIWRGNFPETSATTVGAAMELGAVTLSNGQSVPGEGNEAFTWGMVSPSPGLLLVGTDAMLVPRVSGALVDEAASSLPDSVLGRMASTASTGVYAFAAFQPSEGARALMMSDGPQSVTELVSGLDRIIWSVGRAGATTVEVRARNADSHRDYELMLGGLAELSRAAPDAMWAFAHIALGLLSPDDPEIDASVRQLLAHRDEALAWLETTGWLADSEVGFTADAATFTSTMTSSNGSSLQFGAMIMMVGVVGLSRSVDAPSSPGLTPPPTPPY
jgi:hypothetical protein